MLYLKPLYEYLRPFVLGLGIETNFTIRFNFDYDSIQYRLFWISVTINGKFSQGNQIS